MLFSSTLLSLAALACGIQAAQVPITYANKTIPPPGSDGKYEISSTGIRAKFIPYGAGISNLFVKGSDGVERDVVLGWDNASYYTIDKWHDHYGGIPGRYANRIKNASFEIDGTTYKVDANEHGGCEFSLPKQPPL
jgi:aldose 1-epimerase